MNGPIINATTNERQHACVRANILQSRALSPAFDEEYNSTPFDQVSMTFMQIYADYAWNSGRFSTWTESKWGSQGAVISLRVFLLPRKEKEVTTFNCTNSSNSVTWR